MSHTFKFDSKGSEMKDFSITPIPLDIYRVYYVEKKLKRRGTPYTSHHNNQTSSTLYLMGTSSDIEYNNS